MNIFFISDWDFTLLHKEIAKKLRYEFGYNCNAIIIGKIFYEKYKDDGFNNSYLMQSTFGEFNEGLDKRDWEIISKEIKEYEKKYGRPTLNSSALSDRTYYYEPRIERAGRILKAYKVIENLLDSEKPDLVIASGFASLPQFAFSDVCQLRKIPILFPLWTRIENYFLPAFTQYEESTTHGVDLFLEPKKESIKKAKDLIKKFNSKPKKPFLESILKYKHFKFELSHIYRFIRYIYRYYFSKTYYGDHTKKPPHLKFVYEARTRLTRKYYAKFLKYDDLPKDIKNWFYFPLHIQPEYSTMIIGTNCIDQIGTLISLSNSISITDGIIVKEHPGMFGRRDSEYYQAIRKIPNVRFVNVNISPFKLIKETKGTITITGSAGIEAMLLGKPVITLGNAVYNSYINLLSLKNIPRAQWSEKILNYINNFKYNSKELIRFLSQIVDQSYSFDYAEPQENKEIVLSTKNIENYYKFVCEQIDLIRGDEKYGRTTIERRSYL